MVSGSGVYRNRHNGHPIGRTDSVDRSDEDGSDADGRRVRRRVSPANGGDDDDSIFISDDEDDQSHHPGELCSTVW